MAQPYIGEIRAFASSIAPRGWAECNGQILDIARNTALFSLVGTTYGGDGETTFGLPNLQARTPIHQGTGPGLTPRRPGEVGGQEAVTLTATQVPAHDHDVEAGDGVDSRPRNRPGGKIWADSPHLAYAPTTGALVSMSASAVSSEGGGQPHENMPPYLVVRFFIALEGVFPSR